MHFINQGQINHFPFHQVFFTMTIIFGFSSEHHDIALLTPQKNKTRISGFYGGSGDTVTMRIDVDS